MSSESLPIVLAFLGLIALFLAMVWVSSRQDKAAREAFEKELKAHRTVVVQRSPFAAMTYFFRLSDRDAGFYLAQGPQGNHTGLLIGFPEGRPAPFSASVSIQAKGRMSLQDLSRRPQKSLPGTAQGFEKSFDLDYASSDKGLVFRLLDGPTQTLIEDLSAIQQTPGETVLEIDPAKGWISSWIPGWEAEGEVRDRALGLLEGIQLRILGETAAEGSRSETSFEV